MSFVIFSYRIKRFTAVASAVFVLALLSGTAAAKPPEPSDEKGVPQYMAAEFQMVKQMLAENAEKMDMLSAKLDAVESQLQSDIESAKGSIKTDILEATTAIRGDLELLQMDVAFLLNDDIELTTELCFDLGASWDFAYTGKVVGGLGWEGVLKGELSAEVSVPGPLPIVPIPGFPALMVPTVAGGVGNTVCLTVPLYSAESNTDWVENFDTRSFDGLVSAIAMPVQSLMPLLAKTYGDVFPAPTSSMAMMHSGLEMFDTSSLNQPYTGLETSGVGIQKSGFKGSYLSSDPNVQMTAALSLDDMITGSPLLGYIMEGDAVESAFEDPCGYAKASAIPGAEVVSQICGAAKALDPLNLCLFDPLHLWYCKD